MILPFTAASTQCFVKRASKRPLIFTAERGFSSVEYLDFPSEHTFTDDESRALKSSLDAHKLTCACYSVAANVMAQRGGMYGEKSVVFSHSVNLKMEN